jgi:hypothetical protein
VSKLRVFIMLTDNAGLHLVDDAVTMTQALAGLPAAIANRPGPGPAGYPR